MTIIKIFLTVIFGVLYIPLNWFFMKLQKWYLPLYEKDRVLFFLVAPFYWTFVLINSIIGVPYEIVSQNLH